MNRRTLSIAAAAVAVAAAAVIIPVAGSASASSGDEQPKVAAPNASSVCTDTFTKGSGKATIVWCVAANGNVVQMTFNGVEQIRIGAFIEGYILCVAGVEKAHDIATDEAGFGAPVRTQPGGPNTLPLTITRTTLDGTMSLAQTYAFTTDSVSVTANVKNLTGASIFNVRYVRHADIDAGGVTSNNWTRSPDAVAATVDGASGLLMGTSTYGQTRTAVVTDSISDTSCSPVSAATPRTGTDDGASLTFDLNTLPAGATKSSIVAYRRI
jgi:hypothetical protein